jgi:Tol biopolymer transport system component
VIKVFAWVVLLAAMAAFGFGVYHFAGLLRTDNKHPVRPTAAAAPTLPGTVYVAQDGALYRLREGRFTQITDDAGWSEPAASPSGDELVAVKRVGQYSDLYLLTDMGRVLRQLTHHQAQQVEANHWSFFPRFSPDGTRVFYSYDNKDPGSYEVDLSIFSIGVDGQGAHQWTNPNAYTGGDVSPVPLKNGGLIYAKYSIDEKSQVHSQVWIQARAGWAGAPLTPAADDCGSPAVSSDEKTIAMVCRRGQLQNADVVVATLNEATYSIGPATTLVRGQLAAAPVFSPDGQTIAFLAPVAPGGGFQLWSVAAAPGRSGATAHALTSNVGLDSTAPPVWMNP